jgi:hypothetical protein
MSMSEKRPGDSTSQLIADAEALRAGKDGKGGKGGRGPGTRQLVRDAERAIGREPSGGGAMKWVGVLALLALALGAAYLFIA